MLTHVILGMRAGSRAPRRVALRRLTAEKPRQIPANSGKFQIDSNNEVNPARRTPQISSTDRGICAKKIPSGTPHLALQV